MSSTSDRTDRERTDRERTDRDASTPTGVVVGYDGSAGARLALDWAVETARRDDRDLTIVHAIGLSAGATAGAYDAGPTAQLYEEMTEGLVEEAVERAAKELDRSRVHAVSLVGSPSAELVEASRHVDLVVTGSRGRGDARSGLLGSTAYAVTAHAHCPVVVVRGDETVHAGPGHPVVVGVDESEAAARALDAAATLAAAAEAPLHVVVVDDVPSAAMWAADPAPGAAFPVPASWVRDVTEETHTASAGVAGALADRVRTAHPGLSVVESVLDGPPGVTVAEHARRVGAGLVVVGSRGRGGFRGMLLGSVSHRVVHDAPCPVMVIR
ncbi:universal stress protein [Intrasporangium sp. YIM S08009]|uniref:universal stress protein n=1 Tax=Intrasporangium zincisolvens TaxID=3080018 RepID=UPI002B05DF60|nr:universal stress protein [Intrasporangium sp. YIM S08009]